MIEKNLGADDVDSCIHGVRGRRVMLDSDLARIYGVTTKRLNEQVRRNRSRFPEDFAFQLTAKEVESLRSQFATSKIGRGGRRYLAWAFTEHGAVMLASVLNSPVAIDASIKVVRAFNRLRQLIVSHKELVGALADLERQVAGHDEHIRTLFERIHEIMEPPPAPRKQIGFLK